jgi:hypothetical protein
MPPAKTTAEKWTTSAKTFKLRSHQIQTRLQTLGVCEGTNILNMTILLGFSRWNSGVGRVFEVNRLSCPKLSGGAPADIPLGLGLNRFFV